MNSRSWLWGCLFVLVLLVQRDKQVVCFAALQVEGIVGQVDGLLIVGDQVDAVIIHDEERVRAEVKLV